MKIKTCAFVRVQVTDAAQFASIVFFERFSSRLDLDQLSYAAKSRLAAVLLRSKWSLDVDIFNRWLGGTKKAESRSMRRSRRMSPLAAESITWTTAPGSTGFQSVPPPDVEARSLAHQ